jgi:hypothetical protein
MQPQSFLVLSFLMNCLKENDRGDFLFCQVLWAVQPPVNFDRLNGSERVITNDMLWHYNAQVYRSNILCIIQACAYTSLQLVFRIRIGFIADPDPDPGF